jgi:hypothetical protein
MDHARARSLTIRSGIWLTKACRNTLLRRAPRSFCRRRKRGCHRPSQIIKATWGHFNARNRAVPQPTFPHNAGMLPAPRDVLITAEAISLNFFKVFPAFGNPLCEENDRNSCFWSALYEQTSWSGDTGLWLNRFPPVHAMIAGATKNSGSSRAVSAAGGRFSAPIGLLADIALSGTGSIRPPQRMTMRLPRHSAVGETGYYAQQDADRRLPPGGNAGCRHPR